MRRLFYLLITLATITGCATWPKPKRTIQPIPLLQKVSVNNRLVPIYIPPDSATIQALFECDSLNNVRLKELTELKSTSTKTEFTFQDNTLKYRADFKKDSIRVHVRDSIIEREIPVEVPVVVETNALTGWQWFQIWLGRICGLMLVIFIGFRLTKLYLKLP